MENLAAMVMLRNLNKLTSLLSRCCRFSSLHLKKLLDLHGLERARVGPLVILVSALVYPPGNGEFG